MNTKVIVGGLIVLFLLMRAKSKNAYKKNSRNFLPFCVPIPLSGTEICLQTNTTL